MYIVYFVLYVRYKDYILTYYLIKIHKDHERKTC